MSAPAAPPPGGSGGSNSTIQQMRGQIDAVTAEKKKADDRILELETELEKRNSADLNETERLKRELDAEKAKAASLEAQAQEAQQLSKGFEDLYNDELVSAPEELREKLSAASAVGNWADRVKSLRIAKELAGIGAQPTVLGSVTQPAVQPHINPAQPVIETQEVWDPKKGPPGWETVLTRPQPGAVPGAVPPGQPAPNPATTLKV